MEGGSETRGGGALMNQAIHSVDLLRWMMGDVAEVNAFSTTLGHSGLDVEDNRYRNPPV
jgi:predicted dehydrogenase